MGEENRLVADFALLFAKTVLAKTESLLCFHVIIINSQEEPLSVISKLKQRARR